MIGVEGGIPYSTPKPVLVTHAIKPGTFSRPLCGTDAWRYRTSSNPEHITCRYCKEQS
jgi:hypothetical protein